MLRENLDNVNIWVIKKKIQYGQILKKIVTFMINVSSDRFQFICLWR